MAWARLNEIKALSDKHGSLLNLKATKVTELNGQELDREKDRMLSLHLSILQSQVKKFLTCVSPFTEETLSMFGRTSQIRTGDLYHVKAHRTRHNTLGHPKV